VTLDQVRALGQHWQDEPPMAAAYMLGWKPPPKRSEVKRDREAIEELMMMFPQGVVRLG
jgi:hypothetical protein